LIIFESIRVSRESLGRPQGVAGYDRASIPAFMRCAEAIHAEGAKLFGQVIPRPADRGRLGALEAVYEGHAAARAL
jgi:2,4-dienoyl-CoA reductase-like NADH-dependent reductase (Old Yellow Enzyme family)